MDASAHGVELQINLAPTDLPHARWLLPHQLRRWGGQVDSIQLTVDLLRSHGHYAAAWEERRPGLLRLLDDICRAEPRAHVVEVDYSTAARAAVAETYFGGVAAPAKDCYGAPFHSYFYGLLSATRRYVFHMDSDLLYGGDSRRWIEDAIAVMRRRPDVIACNPLPGAPTSDGTLRSQTLEVDDEPGPAFRHHGLSTRLFLIDAIRFRELTPLPILGLPRLRRMQCAIEGRVAARPAEASITAAMERMQRWRVDFLGRDGGAWAIHPPYRSSAFYSRLPLLIARIESGDVPDEQRGRHDVHDSLVDWTDVRPTRASRIRHHVTLVASNMFRADARVS